jgi:hypothetical protein
MAIEERRADARALADELRRALIEASSTIDGDAIEAVESPRASTPPHLAKRQARHGSGPY